MLGSSETEQESPWSTVNVTCSPAFLSLSAYLGWEEDAFLFKNSTSLLSFVYFILFVSLSVILLLVYLNPFCGVTDQA